VSPLDTGCSKARTRISTAALYRELLPKFSDLLDPRSLPAALETEDAHLQTSIDAIERGEVRIDETDALDLAIVTVPDAWSSRAPPLHAGMDGSCSPMAVTTRRTLRMPARARPPYRLELRYETWVMFVSRPVLRARPDCACSPPR